MTTAPPQAPPDTGRITPIPRTERSLAPDIARGGMLLFIAVANVAVYLWGRPVDDHGHLADASTADHIALFLEQVFMAERSRPMFAILYGFGMAVMASRLRARGADPKGVRKVLRRRSWWLILLGLLHASLLFFGDILAPYGATGLIALAFVHLSTPALRRWLVGTGIYVTLVTVPVFAYMLTADSIAGAPFDGSLNYPDQLLMGALISTAAMTFMAVLMVFVPLVILGIMTQRAGWFDRPEAHLPELRKVFLSGMAVNIASSLPTALVGLGAWHVGPGPEAAFAGLTVLGGMYAGLGYICGFALLAHRLRSFGRRGIPGALAAVGERSLTSYLCQSVIMAPLLMPWGLGFGEHLGYLGAYGVAVGAWAVTVALAVIMDRMGRRGPFEALLRRLTYGARR
ncbi:DUF418 domain-containing protein [Glycomyces halotolerans]